MYADYINRVYKKYQLEYENMKIRSYFIAKKDNFKLKPNEYWCAAKEEIDNEIYAQRCMLLNYIEKCVPEYPCDVKSIEQYKESINCDCVV